MALGLFPGCGCLATNVVERFFAIGAKLGVLEFPCLSVVNTRPTRIFFFFKTVDLRFAHMATGHFLHYFVAPCGNRICSVVGRN